MNPEVKKMWISALLNGEYKQGTNVLANANTNQFCCLGVLCEVAVKKGVVERKNVRYTLPDKDERINAISYGSVHPRYDVTNNVTFLPPEVMEWADIHSPDPKVEIKQSLIGEKTIRALSLLNDEGSSFAEIAKLIEDQL